MPGHDQLHGGAHFSFAEGVAIDYATQGGLQIHRGSLVGRKNRECNTGGYGALNRPTWEMPDSAGVCASMVVHPTQLCFDFLHEGVRFHIADVSEIDHVVIASWNGLPRRLCEGVGFDQGDGFMGVLGFVLDA